MEPAQHLAGAPHNAPDEGEGQQEHRRGGLAHGVEAQRDEHERVVRQANVQPGGHAVWHHCKAPNKMCQQAEPRACDVA